jgi:(2Fe-2S) ferredoxin
MAIKDLVHTQKCLFICNGSCCSKKNAQEITLAIRAQLHEMSLDEEYHTVRTMCMGRCDDAPVAMLTPDNIWLKNIQINDCKFLISKIQNQKVHETQSFLYKMGESTINSDSRPTKSIKQKELAL